VGWTDEFLVSKADVRYVGKDLSRPECIVAQRDGTLWISDDRGALTKIDPDGHQSMLGQIGGAPNGLAMDRSGNFVIANVADGTVYHMKRDGSHTVILSEVEGVSINESANFVCFDSQDRLWITVSTRAVPRSEAIANPRPDGYIILVDEKGPRVVADGLMFTNELRLDADEKSVYVAETTAGRISKYPLNHDGSLGTRQIYGPEQLAENALIDGICFDVEGNLWITEINRNGLLILTPEGEVKTVFEDPTGETIFFPTSITFGGPDLKTVYVGSLKMDELAVFQSPVAGLALSHWT
jgi:gluconolactonase